MNKKYKYPRTPHVYFSPGKHRDDRILENFSSFKNKNVIINEKLDGEGITLYNFGLHARSVDSIHRPWRTWIKSKQAELAHTIPDGFRVCGECMYARHSIPYDNLLSYFYVFSVWNGDFCLDWEYTKTWAKENRLPTPRVFYEGPFNENILHEIDFDSNICEGWVMRNVDSFTREEFGKNVVKFVRKGHVKTDDVHWTRTWTKNQLVKMENK